MKDQFMGQALLTLHHQRVWSRGGTFFLPLQPMQVVNIQENRWLFSLCYLVHCSKRWCALIVRYVDGQTNRSSWGIFKNPPLSQEFSKVKYTPMTSMDQTCGFLYGPSWVICIYFCNICRIDNILLGVRQIQKGEEIHHDFQSKKIWVVITNGRIYLFKRFGKLWFSWCFQIWLSV